MRGRGSNSKNKRSLKWKWYSTRKHENGAGDLASGAKARRFSWAFWARLKSCPSKDSRIFTAVCMDVVPAESTKVQPRILPLPLRSPRRPQGQRQDDRFKG